MITLHKWVESLTDTFTLYGGGKGGGGESQTQQGIDPMLKPYVQYGLNEAQNLYQSATPNYYPGQTYVGPSQATQAALQAQQNRALGGNPLLTQAQANIGNLQTATNVANPMFQNIYSNAQTSPSLANSVYGGLASGQMGNMAQPLNQFSASGGYLGSNPYFNQALAGAGQAATNQYFDAINQAQSGASQAGRYGSNAQENLFNRAGSTLASTLANKAGELAYNQYGMERGLQESALGRLGATSAQDITNRLAGAQALTGVGQQTLQNQLSAASGLAGTSGQDLSRQLAAGQAAPALAEADYGDINKLLQVGQQMEDYQGAALESDIDRFNYGQNLPQNKLNQFLSQVYGAPMGTTSTTTQSGGKIVCTAMNHVYGFGSFRNKIWLAQSANLNPAYEKGYHAVFLPIIMFAYLNNNPLRTLVRSALEHVARHRTADIWKQKRGKRDKLGMIYRAILEPICFVVGKVKGA